MKKKIPLLILKKIQPIIDGNLKLINQIKDEKSIFHLKDNDPNSNFYFKVVSQANIGKLDTYNVEFYPKNDSSLSKLNLCITVEEIVTRLNSWLSLIESYNKIQTIYDDPIEKSYQEGFEKQFVEILEDDADNVGFDLSQQLFLDEYLNMVKTKINLLKAGKPDNEVQKLIEIENQADEMQKQLTKETKRQIVKRLSRIWAKSQKVGLDVIKEIFVNVSAELIKRLITGG